MNILSSHYFRHTLALLLAACLIPMLMLGFSFINLFGDSVNQLMLDNGQQQAQRIGGEIDALLAQAIQLAHTCAGQMTVKSVLSYLPGSVEIATLEDTLNLLTLEYGQQMSIHVVGRTHSFSTAELPEQYAWKNFSQTKRFASLDSMPRASQVFSEPYTNAQGEWIVLSVVMPVCDYHNRFVGYTIVDLQESLFTELLRSEGAMEMAVWCDKKLLLDTSADGLFTVSHIQELKSYQAKSASFGMADGETHCYYWSRGDYNQVTRVFRMDTSEAVQIRTTAIRLLALLLVLSALSAFALALMTSLHQSRPILALHHAMDCVSQGNLSVQVELRGKDELSELGRRFNLLVKQLDSNIQATAQREAELRRQENAALQAQINPHFIYNSMGAARSLIRMGMPEKASEIIAHLGTLLHSNFQSVDAFIPLSEDITLIQSYMVIQNLRFNDRFTLHVQIPSELMDCLVPRLILQPLVENAVRHGLEPLTDSGTVWVTGAAEGNDLLLSVEDNGVGISSEMEEALNSDSPVCGHIGYQNVRRRIELTYGAGYTAHISATEQGTRVTLRLRLQREENPCTKS